VKDTMGSHAENGNGVKVVKVSETEEEVFEPSDLTEIENGKPGAPMPNNPIFIFAFSDLMVSRNFEMVFIIFSAFMISWKSVTVELIHSAFLVSQYSETALLLSIIHMGQ